MGYFDFVGLAEKAENDPSMDPEKLDETVNEALDYCIEQGSERLISTLRPLQKKQAAEMQKDFNLSYNSLYSYLSGRRTFSPGLLGIMCERYMHTSCHDVMFGEDMPVVLPKAPALIAQTLCEMPEIFREKVVDDLFSKFTPFQKEIQKAPVREELCWDRAMELANDLQIPLSRMYSDRNPSPTLSVFSTRRTSSLLFHMSGPDGKWQSKRPGMNTVLQYSLLMGVSLDYLICEDYTQTAKISYYNGQKVVPVEDVGVQKIIGLYLRLPEEQQHKLITAVVLTQVGIVKLSKLMKEMSDGGMAAIISSI